MIIQKISQHIAANTFFWDLHNGKSDAQTSLQCVPSQLCQWLLVAINAQRYLNVSVSKENSSASNNVSYNLMTTTALSRATGWRRNANISRKVFQIEPRPLIRRQKFIPLDCLFYKALRFAICVCSCTTTFTFVLLSPIRHISFQAA